MSFMVLVPLSIGMGAIGLVAFFWAMRHDQFDDPEGAAVRILMPDDRSHRQGPGLPTAEEQD